MLDSHCANCLASFTPQENSGEAPSVKSNMLFVDVSLNKTQHAQEENIQEISVAQALSSIFHMPFTTPTVSEEHVCICDSCYVDLRSLFITFKNLFHRQRKESFISQTIAFGQRTRQNKTGSKGSNKNKNKNKSAQTQTDDLLDFDSFMKIDDDDPRYPEVEIKVEAEDPEDFDEYSDPLQVQDGNLDGAEEMSHAHLEDPRSNFSTNSDSNPIKNPKKRNKNQSRDAKKKKKKEENEVEDGLPTFEATLNLPSVDRYLPFRLKSLQPPFTSPCKCEERLFATYDRYREHVGVKHVNFDVFRCERPGANPGETCNRKTGNFQLYHKHCVKYHQLKPVEPKGGFPDLDEELNKYLMPVSKSEEEESNLWCLVHPQFVQKIKHELKPTTSTTSAQVNPEGESNSNSTSKSKSNRKTGEIPPPPYKCTKCYVEPPVEFQILESYIMHMGKNVHETRVFNCTHCSRDFSGKSNDSIFIQHCKKVHDFTPDLSTLPTTVKTMDKTFSAEQEKDRQRISYKPVLELLGDPPYSCPQNHDNDDADDSNGKSGGPFNCMTDFWAHLKTVHFSKKDFICPKCAKTFTSKRGWDDHVNRFCGKQKKKIEKRYLPPFICSMCEPPREFTNRSALTVHISGNHFEKNFVCETCGNGFTTQGRLNEHAKFHGTDYPAVCEICGRSYKTNGNLRMHFRITHSEEGRLKYNEYCRNKNRRKKMQMTGQNEQGNSNQNQNNAESSGNFASHLDIAMQVDDSEQDFEQGDFDDNSMNTE